MNRNFNTSCPISRRDCLMAGAFLAAGLGSPRWLAHASSIHGYRLVAAPGRAALLGAGRPRTEVWAYNGASPGPTLRVPQGEPVRILVENRLAEDTTIHWHGIRLPFVMDGVPGLSQAPIRPGESFVYEFTPPDAGTFWYHSHTDGLRQLGRGLAGALVIEEPTPVAVDRDVLWMLSDWRLRPDARIASGFGNAMEAAMSGRVGNLVTVNGRRSDSEPVRAGERIRLRLVNGALARIMSLRFEGHWPIVVAIDGQPCEPHEPEGGQVLLGPAMRADLVLDMRGEPGRRYEVSDDFYDGLAYRLTQLAYDERPPVRARPPDFAVDLPRNPVPEPDLARAERHMLVLQGGMMSGMGAMTGVRNMADLGRMMGGMDGVMMRGMGGMKGRKARSGAHAEWSINGMSMTGDGQAGMPPLLTLRGGQSYLLTLRNDTAWWHPMHLHGHSFWVLSRNGAPVPHRHWADTVLIAPKESVEIAFVAGQPGDWMLHCHVTDHQASGMMTAFRVA